MDASSGLRAGDALHLAYAKQVKAPGMVTLDGIFGKITQRRKMKPVVI